MYTHDNPDPAWLAEDEAAAREAEELYWQWYSAMEDRALEEAAFQLEAAREHAPEQVTLRYG